jgi:gamma-glutamylcyclotransferase (GGCT)/AIG2-like uncharacterized protein YtfP
VTRFDPDAYPGTPPERPVVVWDGRARDLEPETLALRTAPADAAPVLRTADRRHVLAYGSNACVDRLVDKGLDRRGVVVLPAAAWGWASAWEARRSTSTGAVPLTLVPSTGRRLDAHVLGVHPADLDRLDASEFRGRNYALAEVGDIAIAARWHLRGALAYRPTRRTMVLTDGEGRPLTHPEHDQEAAVESLGGEAAPVGAAREPVEGWPPTPLEPLDLFVYGTLQPGERRWEAVRGACAPVGPATAHGSLWDTGRGWPAARFGPGDDVVHGTLLRPNSPHDATRLLRTTDRIESEGEVFDRVAVRVMGPGGEGWAAAYAWRGDPPGRRITSGRWC